MRLTLTQKLLLALLLANIVLVTIMAVAGNQSFRRGFMNYLRQVELRQLNDIAQALSNDYATERSWDFLRNDMGVWREYLSYLPGVKAIKTGRDRTSSPAASNQPSRRAPHPPPPERTGQTEEGRVPRPLPEHPLPYPEDFPPPGREYGPPDRAGLGPAPERPGEHPLDDSSLIARLSLFDKMGQRVVGVGKEGKNPLLRPIKVDGEVVGSLRLITQGWLDQGLEHEFSRQQRQALLYAAMAAFLLSLLVSIPLGRHLLRPVKGLLEGIRSLAAGSYEARMQRSSSDELGDLTDDFNLLAATLEKNEELRRHAMADVSHELRTPLSVLRGEIEAIQDGIRVCDEERLTVLHKTVLELSRLVDDLYELALSDQGALSYCQQPVDVTRLLARTVQQFQGELQKHGIRVQGKIKQGLEVRGDEGRLGQVFSNLLKNTLCYTDKGGQLRISCHRQKAFIKIRFEDSAPAVPTEDLPRLFDRFFRVERSRNRSRGGAGLGLALCKNIIEAHDGAVKAKKSELGGLEIHIWLPLHTDKQKGRKRTVGR